MNAQTGSRGTLLNLGARRGVSDQHHIPVALPLGKRVGTHCTCGWVGPSAGLDGCGKCLHRDSIHGPPSQSKSLYRIRFPGKPLNIVLEVSHFNSFCSRIGVAMKAYGGGGRGLSPLILNLVAKWR
jgi:hypothetical protein